MVTPLGARGKPLLRWATRIEAAWLGETAGCGSDLPGLVGAVSMLLSPIEVGSHGGTNRIAFTAHGSFLDFYRPGVPGNRYVAYEERRAAGGAGLIFLQTVHVHPSSHALGHSTYEPDDLRAKLTAMATAVHRHGAKVVQQLNHFGAQFRSDARANLEPLWAMRRPRQRRGRGRAQDVTGAEIEEVLDGFARHGPDLRRGRLDGSSSTARTATCCSSRSARGATSATTNGASRSPSRRR